MNKLRAMEIFLSISQTHNFSRTARRFDISATAVSRLITELEEELKVKLLLRSTRQLLLTESGQEYAHQLHGIIRSIADAEANITAISAAPRGMLRIHSRMMFGVGLLPALIAGFRKLHPEIHIDLTVTEAAVDLRNEQFDIEFRISPPVEAGIKRRMLFQSERHLVATPAYLATRPELLEPNDILAHDCLVYQLPGEQYTWSFRREGTITEIAFVPRHISNNAISLLKLARLGEGLVLAEDYTVHDDIRQGTLVRVLTDYRITNNRGFEDGMYATILDTAIIPAKIRLFLDFVADHVAGAQLRFEAYSKADVLDAQTSS